MYNGLFQVYCINQEEEESISNFLIKMINLENTGISFVADQSSNETSSAICQNPKGSILLGF